MNRYRDLTEFAKVGIASWPQQYVGQPASGTTMAPSSSVSVRNRLVTTAEWQGYSRNTLKTYGSIVTRFPPQLRYLNADCSHYQAVASLPNELAMPLPRPRRP